MKLLFTCWVVFALYLAVPALPAWAQGPVLDPSFLITTAVRMDFGGVGAADMRDMLLQPDGKLIVAGDFRSINGRPALRVARLLSDGQVDTTFNAPPADGEISSIALQADGKVLVAGQFTTVGGQSRIGIARLLPNGTLDPGFLSPFGGGPLPLYAYSNVEKIVMQPGRGILVLGGMVPINPTPWSGFYAARLLEATGALDPTFQPSFTTFDTHDVLVQPNGHLVFAGRPHQIGGQPCTVWGTLPDGAPDPAYVPLLSPTTTFIPLAFGLTRDPATGHLYVVRYNPRQGLPYEPVRLLPGGGHDPSFSLAGVFPSGLLAGAYSLAVQPNGRLLLGGSLPLGPGLYAGSARLLPSGALDPSYVAANGPDEQVRKVLVQPDGALLFCGVFNQVSGLPVDCLTRLLDSNVLSAHAPGPADEAKGLGAWPVPARAVLHLRLPAARLARQVDLLDALGRVVLRQALPAGQREPTLPTAGLPPGGYLLRVSFADGPPAYRRVAVE